ncbi:MAG: XdhC family protein, partial [Bacteroidota bacterium]
MTHELKAIFEQFEKAQKVGMKSVLASVVSLDGSSYRRPGVRMLVLENGQMVGAVSGGCVEKEVKRQAASVFENGIPKVMVYDGRYRLGCDGILYILIEPFAPKEAETKSFWEHIESRQPIGFTSYFSTSASENPNYGSSIAIGSETIRLNPKQDPKNLERFEQVMEACFRFYIIGAEHDAVQLGHHASLMGWEVIVVAHPTESKTQNAFPGIQKMLHQEPEQLDITLDENTAVVVMTHSFAKDLGYVLSLSKLSLCAYIGLLGPSKRREKLIDAVLERHPEITETYMDTIHGPA